MLGRLWERLILFYSLRLPTHPGKWRVVNGLLRTLSSARLRQTAGRIAMRQGLLWCLATECWVQRELFYHGEWDGNEMREVLNHLPRNPVFLDVGSYFGYYALMVARHAPGASRVFALEPVPSNFALLEHNIHLNQMSNVTALPLAASDRVGEADLVLPPAANLGSGHLSLAAAFPDAMVQRVRTVTLDAFVRDQELDTVDFIKLDVEGVELAVLRGARETLQRFKPGVLLELNPPALRAAGVEARALLRLLEGLGYDFHETTKHGLRPFGPADIDAHPRLVAGGYVNLLCLPAASRS